VRREPAIGQQFIELVCGMGRQATEDVPKVREGIDVVVLAAAGQGVEEDRRSPTTTVTPEEGRIAAPDRLGTEHPLGEVIVDAQLPTLRVVEQRLPVGLREGDRLADRALGQYEVALLGQPLPEGRLPTRM
jgi:hypothetical protein